LRNVALRRKLLSQRRFHALKDARLFYAERDRTRREMVSPGRDGAVPTFDDLPVQCHANVNVEPPFGPASRQSPAPSSQEIDDIIAFLQTLKDGYWDEKRRW
jgi:cytochrome c peroxidase